jgi:hypothetical protein
MFILPDIQANCKMQARVGQNRDALFGHKRAEESAIEMAQ